MDDTWQIELDLNRTNDWRPVRESWFTDNPQRDGKKDMRPRPLEECSETAVSMRHVWITYEEGSMRLRNLVNGEIIPFEIFT